MQILREYLDVNEPEEELPPMNDIDTDDSNEHSRIVEPRDVVRVTPISRDTQLMGQLFVLISIYKSHRLFYLGTADFDDEDSMRNRLRRSKTGLRAQIVAFAGSQLLRVAKYEF